MVRVCIIGGGASGLSVIYQILRLRRETTATGGAAVDIEFECYEKQQSFGGLWNFDWRTGTDEHGESVHSSMYKQLWVNAPKEAGAEYPDYTFLQHFGKSIGSYPPREVMRHYLAGRFSQYNIPEMITYNTIVRSVTFDESSKKFTVIVKNLLSDLLMPPEQFDFVINCSGHFSVPNVPYFPGIETFTGRILHSHDFRSALEFKDLRVIAIGSSYSAQDIVMQVMKFGAKSALMSHRKPALNFVWPYAIYEKPIITNIQASTVTFSDGSNTQCDAIILCTGYQHHYPYLADNLRLTGPNQLFPENLFNGILWTKAACGRMMYIGAQDQAYSFKMFDVQARWAVKYMANHISLPDHHIMEHDISSCRNKQLNMKSANDFVNIQTEYLQELAQAAEYGADVDTSELFHDWLQHRQENMGTYRDRAHNSKYNSAVTPQLRVKWTQLMNDSMQEFMNAH